MIAAEIQRLKSNRGEVEREARGMKGLVSIKRRMALELGVKPRASYKVVLDAIDRKLAELQHAAQKPASFAL